MHLGTDRKVRFLHYPPLNFSKERSMKNQENKEVENYNSVTLKALKEAEEVNKNSKDYVSAQEFLKSLNLN